MRSTHSLASQAICAVNAIADTACAAYSWPRVRMGAGDEAARCGVSTAYNTLHCTIHASGHTRAPKFSSVVRAICQSLQATSAIAGSSAMPTSESRGQRTALETSSAAAMPAVTHASAACGVSILSRCRFSSNAPPASHQAAPTACSGTARSGAGSLSPARSAPQP
jgi:hypothetical protein